MDQIHYIPQAGNQKKKGGKAPQECLLQLWPRPSAAEDKGSDHPGRGAEDMLKRARGVSSGVFAASFPRGLFHQKTYSGGEHERPRRGRLRSGRKVRCSESATFYLQHHAPGRASAEEYQGSHKGDMVAYHAPRKVD